MNKYSEVDMRERFIQKLLFKKMEKKNYYFKVLTKSVLLFILNILFSMIGFSANYYVSNAGDDSNTGLSSTSPWKTLEKVNSVTLAANDAILFRRGDKWTGALIPQRSYITYGAYDTGAKPIISGFQTVTGWVSQGNGIYRAATIATSACNMVTVNGVNTPMGRYPKTGWLTFESYVGRTSITDSQLAATPNWTGAEVVIKKNNWTIDRSAITNHSGTNISYTSGSTSNPVLVHGEHNYFIQKSITALTQLGDWYCDGTYLYMYFGANAPTNYEVKASVLDNIITINSLNTVVFSNLSIEGSNVYGAFTKLSVNIQFLNCDFINNGNIGIYAGSSITIIVDGCTINQTNGIAISIHANTSQVKNCSISNTAMSAGMGNANGATYYGMSIRSTDGIIEYNTVTNTGYIPILFYNSNFKVRYNKVDGFCSIITDGAGIYTYESGGITNSGQEVYNNIILNGGANGLYSDGLSNNVNFHDNTVISCLKNGIHMNNPVSDLVQNNTFYDCAQYGISLQNLYQASEGNDGSSPVVAAKNTISNNLIVTKANTQRLIDTEDARTYSIINFGTSDNNKFIVESGSLNLFNRLNVLPSYSKVSYNFNDWKTFSNKESNSILIPTILSDVHIEYNATKSIKTISLVNPMVDTKGNKYSSNVTLQPFTSIVLIKDVASIVAPDAPTSVVATAGNASASVSFFVPANNGGSNINGYTVTSIPEGGIDSNAGSNSLTHIISGLTNGTSYSFIVKATNSAGTSVSSTVSNSVVPIGAVSQSVEPTSHFKTVWQGENGQNHMNIIVMSALFEDLSLSKDDEIAVYCGSNCVGTKKLNKTIDISDNSTFLTIPVSQNDGSNNGFIENDSIIFKIWINETQQEIFAKSVTYKSDIPTWQTSGKFNTGATSVVQIASYIEFSQVIELKKGYNMISSYVSASNPLVCEITKPLIDKGSLIKVQDEAGNSYENWGSFGGWINKVGAIEKTEGYKIKVANNCELVITGRPIVLPLNIPLKVGWNIISFPNATMVNAMSIIQPLIDQNKLIKVQDEIGNSIEDWGIFGGWKNGIGNFIPGKAYKVKMSSDAILILQQNYSKSAVINAHSEKTKYFSSSIEGNGNDHMNINLVGLDESHISCGDEIAAFDGDICVGALKVSMDNKLNGLASLIVSSGSIENTDGGFVDGHPISIRLWNHIKGIESNFETEIVTGNMKFDRNASIILKLKSFSTDIENLSDIMDVDVYPNPSNGKFIVRFSQLAEIGSNIVILDTTGRKITSRLITNLSEDFNLENLPRGLYLVKLVLGSNEIIKKMVIN